MDLEDYQNGERVERVYWEKMYDYVGHSGNWGFAFPCTESGVLLLMGETAQKSLENCKANPDKFDPPYIRESLSSYFSPAKGKCACGRWVICDDPLWNSCDCGRYYNMSGTEVNPPHSGQYETGETVFDIYNGRDEDY